MQQRRRPCDAQVGNVREGVLAVAAMVATTSMSTAHADDAQAKSLFKAMSDYLAAQKAISFAFGSTLEVVTDQQQKLGLASSGTLTLNRLTSFTQHARADLPMSRWSMTGRR
jgi:hypothetical protein